MNEQEALRVAREAMKRATERHGEDRAAILADVEEQANADPKLLEAFSRVGHLLIQSEQADRH
ncbi:hypothetical protein DEE91_00930 [Ralstonia pickettii]|jgi:hypothetical protein|uniref:hypothetical protein n=1 Tax=Ralstonia sp. RRA TaxID=3122075 RepID=UPI000664B308|nr:hypothetical protein AC240_07115 [Ralstonia sp. MD27]MBA9854463.1 hypothetical protein [Ralstonia insidiosa]MBX3770302.1 hypothetical protein [Ralstonia pickettii]NOZ14830.1 hypothetical protein [Betaproteobacteria bacterium]MBA9868278.1 hypothetical protein [Ralstonia insidiosa]